LLIKSRAAEQSSINETAEEFSSDAKNKTCRGKYKKNETKGANMELNYTKHLMVWIQKNSDPLPEVDQATYDKLSTLYNKSR
jgi:hypothetical protein